jgi:hypothetical protein
MKRNAQTTGTTLFAVCVAALLTASAPANAQTDPPASGGSPPATVPPAEQAAPQAGEATAKANGVLAGIRERGASLDANKGRNVEEKLNSEKKTIDQAATSGGDATVAGRLSQEFGIGADALLAERAKYGTGWGDLTIAHLLISERADLTMDQLFELRQQGQGWGQITHGMDLNLGRLVSALRSEGRVATGAEAADGKVPGLRGSEAQARAAEAKAAKGAQAGHADETATMKQPAAARGNPSAQNTPPARSNPAAGTTPPSNAGRGRSGK